MDWANIIKTLESRGMTQVEIARQACCSQGLISDLKRGYRGTRLDYRIGSALVRLRDGADDRAGLRP